MMMVSGPKKALEKILAMLMVKNVGQGTSVFHHSDQAENFWGSPRTPTIRIQLSKSVDLAKKIPKKVGE